MKKKLLFSLFAVINFYSMSAQCIADVSSGLIARWDFDGNAKDLSGNGHDGNVVGASLTEDRCGYSNGAYSFFENNQYINVPDAADLRLYNTDFTISAWIYKFDTTKHNHYAIIAKRPADLASGFLWYIKGDNPLYEGRVGFTVTGNAIPGGITNSVVSWKSWQHVVVTYTLAGSELRFYVNGLLNGISSMPVVNNSMGNLLRIGNDNGGSTYGFNGKIDDIKIYNHVLDSCSIDKLYRAQCAVVLPVSFQSFTGISKNNGVYLDWKTGQDLLTDYFILERSSDGTNFKNIREIAGANNSSFMSYEFIDAFPLNGNNYYRVKSVSKDGSIVYSSTVLLKINIKEFAVQIFPNPVANTMLIRFYRNTQPTINLQIIDFLGRTMQKHIYNVPPGGSMLSINTSGLAPGVYRIFFDDKALPPAVFVK